jgi:lipopolysaccharide/colanic/teichoic acid biosynthesis glycosyltransferase
MLQLNRRRYGSGVRNLRGYQRFRRAHADATLDQMKRLAHLAIAGVLLAMTSPLMLLVTLAIRWEGLGPNL